MSGPGLDAAEKADIAEDLDLLLPSTLTLHDKEETDDERTGTIETAGPVLQTYNCRKGKSFVRQTARRGRWEQAVVWPVMLESGAVVAVGQLVTLQGEIYEVDKGSGGDWQVQPKIEVVKWRNS